ncbi:MAG TPA: glutathione binding-like protein [Beijerinckiaceae bacterium]|jgi:glutathione S-transferase|nr:glutathione binding-like protein [Beijerinckiaceae bacterium]
MDLYFSPLACSMASRIVIYETGADARFIEVDPKTKRTREGEDFFAINPLGLVPTLRTHHGEVLTENAAILQFIADAYPNVELAPPSGMARSRLHQWLCFIGTELHKALFAPLFDPKMPQEGKARTLQKAESRLAYLNTYLEGREFLLDRFSVADAYLFTVLNWNIATPIDLKKWPAVEAYYARLKQRPSIARALSEEHALYAAELQRHKAA